jgi:hypothetical protein
MPVFDAETMKAIEAAQKAVGDKYTRGLIDFFGQPTQTGPTPFQEQAASRATRLYRQAGPDMQMELDDRYRANMLGNPLAFPISAGGETPMQNLRKAEDISENAAKRRATTNKSTLQENAQALRASNKKRGL